MLRVMMKCFGSGRAAGPRYPASSSSLATSNFEFREKQYPLLDVFSSLMHPELAEMPNKFRFGCSCRYRLGGWYIAIVLPTTSSTFFVWYLYLEMAATSCFYISWLVLFNWFTTSKNVSVFWSLIVRLKYHPFSLSPASVLVHILKAKSGRAMTRNRWCLSCCKWGTCCTLCGLLLHSTASHSEILKKRIPNEEVKVADQPPWGNLW